jgi:PAS domain S-box-containing protein
MILNSSTVALGHLRSKYYKTFRRRVSSKTGHLLKADRDEKIIARLRAELKSLSFKFRSVFDHSHSYYIILDKEMNIIDFNKASQQFVKRLFGKKMIIGESILNFLHPSSAKMVTENCNRAFGGEKFIIERKISYLDNSVTHWSLEFSPATNLRGNITGLVFNANDITKRKAYEERIRSQHKKLVEIAAMQSHEIRGPVSTIMGLMSLIKDADRQDSKEYLLLLETTTELLDKNIREIVDRAGDD